MDNNTPLIITYGTLKEMLDEFQTDGYNSDGCSCSIYLDADEEIQDAIKDGTIKVAKKKKKKKGGGEKYEVQSYKVQSCETCRFYNKELYWCDRLNDTTYKPNCSSYQAIE